MNTYQLIWLGYDFLGVAVIFAISRLFAVLTINNTYKKKIKL